MQNNKNYDFAGWATMYNYNCSDGRTIKPEAFKHCDGSVVPLVWNHKYDGPESVIGNVTLTHMDKGVYAYASFNDTSTANTAKNLVKHGDIRSLSIYANKLKQDGHYVLHGDIKEVSLVLAGANPGASIQEVLVHGDANDVAAVIYNDSEELVLAHSDESDSLEDNIGGVNEEIIHADKNETVADVYNTLSDKQKRAVAMIIEDLLESEDDEPSEGTNKPEDEKKEEIKHSEGESNMKVNVFDQNGADQTAEIKHSEIIEESLRDAKKYGTLKESFIAHAGSYGINNIEMLFPDAVNVSNEPYMIDRDQTWVGPFLNAVKKSPFSRLKAIYADITADEARALGYTKGAKKKEEVFGLLKRTTSPTTIYKKQKLDRDDIIDITDFSVVAFLKKEMKGKLQEEIARAILVGDGRSSLSPDKIKEANIRPILKDDDLYTIKHDIGADANQTTDLIEGIIRAANDYEGTGIPNLYIAPQVLTELLLIKDNDGRYIYDSVAKLADKLNVKSIIKVPFMKGLVRELEEDDSKTHTVLGIVVNPADYTIGCDKGGQVAMFDDFDIDYNQQKYLMETRMSGSLLKPKTAMVIEKVTPGK